ncbi:helix-turn-helix transcriptional regulator [Demequina sp. NBRC 110056]|uniref:helix-turn-helix transcriptional regulator n=1 Tax=Demequina sp. NBRC 110056 TaxID=1570345 RepID=UPI000A046A0F|nr:helix-turn-helix transcriptional regulator [Demequina sp. NBRC 110056]
MNSSTPSSPGTELGVFLRSRRDRLTPEDVGLVRGAGVRRTPGLRREELAALAGISIDYYIRLERGTERHPSVAVVESLARALDLNEDERHHLQRLAVQSERRDLVSRVSSRRPVGLGVTLLLERLRPFPAYVTNRIGDVLAWNPGGLGMLPGIEDWPAAKRNEARFAFLHPGAKALYGDWTGQLTGVVSGLRTLAATEPDAADLRELVGELLVKSPEFAGMWERYDVAPPTTGHKRLHHPVVGDMRVGYQAMRLEGPDGLGMLSYYAEPGSPEHDQFVLLDSMAPTDSVAASSLESESEPS